MFVKIFAQVLDSSLAEDFQVRHIFEDILKLVDIDGVCDMTHEAIARRINCPLEMVVAAIAKLEQPDPKSRNRDEEGRRIVRLDQHRDWGWFVVNYHHYRNIESDEQRREKTRERTRKWRQRSGQVSEQRPVTPASPSVTVTPCDASDGRQRQRQREKQYERGTDPLSPSPTPPCKKPEKIGAEPPPDPNLAPNRMAQVTLLHQVWQERTSDSVNIRAYERDWLDFLEHGHGLADIELVIEHTRVWNKNHKPRYARQLTLRRTIGDLGMFGDRLAEAKAWERAGRPMDGGGESQRPPDFAEQGDKL